MRTVPFVTAAILLAGTCFPASAQDPSPAPALRDGGGASNPFAGRGVGLPSIVRYFQSQGVQMVSLGDVGGAKAYLGRGPNGMSQTIVPTPDGRHAVAGIAFRSGGVNDTNRQIRAMMSRFSDAAKKAGVGEPVVPDDDGNPPASDLPILDWFRSQGMTVTDIAMDEGGLDAALVQTPASGDRPQRLQPFYVLPDARYAVAGMLMRDDGMMVTALQVADMESRARLEAATSRKAGSDISLGVNKPGAEQAAFPPGPVDPVVPVPPADAVPAAGKTVAAPASPAAAFRTSSMTSEALVDALKSTAFFAVGAKDAPVLYMVADPQCPWCHEAWRQLRPEVEAGRMQLRIIMIAGIRGSEEMVRSILSRPGTKLPDGGDAGDGPSRAWISGEGSVDGVGVKAGPMQGTREWNAAGDWMNANARFAERFGISRTPFLAYLDAGSQVYSTNGLPDSMGDFLSAIR